MNLNWKLPMFTTVVAIVAALLGSNISYLLYRYDRWKGGVELRVGRGVCHVLPTGWVVTPDGLSPDAAHLRYALRSPPVFATVREHSTWSRLLPKLQEKVKVSEEISVFSFRESADGGGAVDYVLYDASRGLIFTGTDIPLVTELAKNLAPC